MSPADADSGMYAALSNMEMETVLDGGSTRRWVRLKSGGDEWLPAWIDLDGLWIDDDEPGYVPNVGAWEIDLPY